MAIKLITSDAEDKKYDAARTAACKIVKAGKGVSLVARPSNGFIYLHLMVEGVDLDLHTRLKGDGVNGFKMAGIPCSTPRNEGKYVPGKAEVKLALALTAAGLNRTLYEDWIAKCDIPAVSGDGNSF